MAEFRGPVALVVAAAVSVLVLAFCGLTFWWLSRNPKVAARLPSWYRPFFRASLTPSLMTMIALLTYALVWTFDLSN